MGEGGYRFYVDYREDLIFFLSVMGVRGGFRVEEGCDMVCVLIEFLVVEYGIDFRR